MSSHVVVTIAILLLIATKVLALLHVPYSGGVWDLDRVIGLVVFLLVAHRWIEPLKSRTFGILFGVFVIAVGVDLLSSQIGFQRLLQLLVLTALVEEILLRGVLFELLLRKFSPVVTLISTSVLFTVVHPQIYSDLLYAVAVLLTGLLLGWVYLTYRRYSLQTGIVAATAWHMVIIMIGVNIGLIH